jgi:hypothetical protein
MLCAPFHCSLAVPDVLNWPAWCPLLVAAYCHSAPASRGGGGVYVAPFFSSYRNGRCAARWHVDSGLAHHGFIASAFSLGLTLYLLGDGVHVYCTWRRLHFGVHTCGCSGCCPERLPAPCAPSGPGGCTRCSLLWWRLWVVLPSTSTVCYSTRHNAPPA